MLKNISFADYITDSLRLLFLIDAFKEKPAFELTDNRIKLYDYYLKFPKTMLSGKELDIQIADSLDEYYSFFHWQPDIIRYRKNLNFLYSKGFIEKVEIKNKPVYIVTPLGEQLVQRINNDYVQNWIIITQYIVRNISKIADSNIEREIKETSSIANRINNKGVFK